MTSYSTVSIQALTSRTLLYIGLRLISLTDLNAFLSSRNFQTTFRNRLWCPSRIVLYFLLIYASKLFEVIKEYLPQAHAHADPSFKADSTYLQIDAVNSVERCMDAIRCWMIEDKLCLNERKSKTDLYGLPMWFLWSRCIIKCFRVTFLLLQACLSEIYLFCRIGGLLKIFSAEANFLWDSSLPSMSF